MHKDDVTRVKYVLRERQGDSRYPDSLTHTRYVHLSRSIATISRIETDHVHEIFACTYT